MNSILDGIQIVVATKIYMQTHRKSVLSTAKYWASSQYLNMQLAAMFRKERSRPLESSSA